MKNITIALLLFASMFSFAQTDTLKLSFDVWPPFTNESSEKSFACDIVKEALTRLDIKSDYQVDDFKSVMDGLNNGKLDGSPALWKSEEREEALVFSQAYLENQLILVTRKGGDVSMTSFAALKNFRIGLVKGYAYSDSINENNFNINYSESDQRNLEKLISHEIDYMLVDALLIQYLLKYELNNVSTMLEIAEKPLINKPLHFALRKDTPGADQTIALFNDEIKKMIADGTYNKLLGLDWICADVDGDGTPEYILIGDKAGENEPNMAYDVYQSEKPVSGKLYINNTLYDKWDDVPNEYKVARANTDVDTKADESMTLTF